MLASPCGPPYHSQRKPFGETDDAHEVPSRGDGGTIQRGHGHLGEHERFGENEDDRDVVADQRGPRSPRFPDAQREHDDGGQRREALGARVQRRSAPRPPREGDDANEAPRRQRGPKGATRGEVDQGEPRELRPLRRVVQRSPVVAGEGTDREGEREAHGDAHRRSSQAWRADAGGDQRGDGEDVGGVGGEAEGVHLQRHPVRGHRGMAEPPRDLRLFPVPHLAHSPPGEGVQAIPTSDAEPVGDSMHHARHVRVGGVAKRALESPTL